VHVAALRRKLGQYGRAIETVRGGGYRLQMHDACA
jgi:DNA-binding response OmpR family regulator